MGRVSTCQKNCNTIDLRRAQVNNHMASKVWDKIYLSIPKLKRLHRWSLGMDQ